MIKEFHFAGFLLFCHHLCAQNGLRNRCRLQLAGQCHQARGRSDSKGPTWVALATRYVLQPPGCAKNGYLAHLLRNLTLAFPDQSTYSLAFGCFHRHMKTARIDAQAKRLLLDSWNT